MRLLSSFLLAALLVGAADVRAQSDRDSSPWEKQAKRLSPIEGGTVISNFIQIMEAGGDSLWHGPLLSVYVEDAPEGQRFQTADEPVLLEDDNVVFALDVVSDPFPASTIWAGLAFAGTDDQPTAGGLLVSRDGGTSFSLLNPPLDAPADSTIGY
ncbi:MAG: hypothetical protein GVY25_16465, partial [Bacteroidetes bacterium]|nr:hypothetical protein [Bacteroidota bacterium]